MLTPTTSTFIADSDRLKHPASVVADAPAPSTTKTLGADNMTVAVMQELTSFDKPKKTQTDPTLVTLAAPSNKTEVNDKSLAMLLAELQKILQDTSVESIKTKQEVSQQLALAGSQNKQMALLAYNNAATALIKANADLAEAMNNLHTAQGDLDTMSSLVADLTSQLSKAQASVNTTKDAFDASPNDPVAKANYENAVAYLNNIGQQLTQSQSKLDGQQQLVNAATVTAQQAGATATSALETLNKCIADLPAPPNDNSLREIQSEIAFLTQCLLQLSKIISKNNENELSNKMEISKEQQLITQKKLEEQAAIFAQQKTDMERKSKIMGIFNHVFGGLMVFASLPLTVATGPLGLMVGAAGVALFTTDEIMMACGTETLSQRTIGPLMEATLGKLTQAFNDALLEAGLDDPNWRAACSALLTVATIAATVYLTKKASNFVTAQTGFSIGTAVSNALTKILPDKLIAFSATAQKMMVAGLGKGMSYYKDAMAITTLGGTFGQSVVGAQIGDMRGNMLEANGKMVAAKTDMDQIRKIIDYIAEQYVKNLSASTDMVAVASDMVAQQSNATAYVAHKNVRA